MTQLFAGIDGGQSSTTAIIADAHGQTLGIGSAGPADEVHEPPQSTRLRDALEGALHAALRAADLPDETSLEAVVAGVSGYDGRVHGHVPRIRANDVTLVHDSRIAHAGALAGDAGIVVIAGTGSVAYGADEDANEVLVGGWGYLFGDEGSAFWLARQALARACCDEDEGATSAFADEALARMGVGSLRSLVRAFYAGIVTRWQIASLAPDVVHLAEREETWARDLVRQGAEALVQLAANALQRLHLREASVAFTGGLMQNAAYMQLVRERMRARVPSARVVAPKYDPARGALLLAYRAAGIRPTVLT